MIVGNNIMLPYFPRRPCRLLEASFLCIILHLTCLAQSTRNNAALFLLLERINFLLGRRLQRVSAHLALTYRSTVVRLPGYAPMTIKLNLAVFCILQDIVPCYLRYALRLVHVPRLGQCQLSPRPFTVVL